MKIKSLILSMMCVVGISFAFTGCNSPKKTGGNSLLFNTKAWKYDESNNVYYQLGVVYAANPQAADIEKLNIYVPAAYLSATDNGDGTYTATINTTATVHGYTAATAPIVFPLETPGYVAQTPASDYSADGVTTFTNEGFVYVFAGMRGRDNGYNEDGSLAYAGGAPWGITDLKAAVRYVRYNGNVLPGNMSEVYTGGMSGGGAQSALMGATGDSELYTPYLSAIGAALTDKAGNKLSDAVTGSMDWCPITNLDFADEAYEWNMGQFASTGDRDASSWKSALSKDLATSWAPYFNKLGLKSPDGTYLTLAESTDGIYQSGTYYDYLKGVIENSLNNFLVDTPFPYTVGQQSFNAAARFGGGSSNMMMGGFGGPGMGGNAPAGGMQPPSDGNAMGGQPPANGQAPANGGNAPANDKAPANGGNAPANGQAPSGNMMQSPAHGGGAGSTQTDIGVTYKTPEDYIASLNKNGTWVTYDKTTNTIKISSIKDFVTHLKNATKGIAAFDSTDLSQGENKLFGTGDSDALHFDATISGLLIANKTKYANYSDWDDSVIQAYSDGVNSKDSLGNLSQVRQDMYNPLYYLNSYYDGYQKSTVAKYWRIRTGIEQSDTALTTEVNLALALKSDNRVSEVDFETVWNMQHTMAERTGSSMDNFISWIHKCVALDSTAK